MKFSTKALRNTVIGALALVPSIALAGPITYNITDGSSGSFTASWLHAGTGAESDGFYMNGNKASISGSITIDTDTGAASGSLATDSADTDFGQGSGSWTIDITGGTNVGGTDFASGDSLLLALDYTLSNGSTSSTGTFYFADTTFTGDVNSWDEDELYLWGNNWFNENGTDDRDDFVAGGGIALGIDLYGAKVDVPEPSILLIFGLGLTGLGLRRRRTA